MARVIINSLLRDAMGMPPAGAEQSGGDTVLRIDAGNIRQLLRRLEEQAPGCSGHLDASHVAVAIDGEIHPDALLQELEEDSEVCFVPAIEGG